MAQHGFCDLSFESPTSCQGFKAEPLNIPVTIVTSLTRQSFSGWLNDEASKNIACIVVTLDVSHALMSSLNLR